MIRSVGSDYPFTYQSVAAPADDVNFRIMPALILVASMSFNVVLAFVNGHVMGVPTALVIGAQASLTAAAFGLALLAWKPQMEPSLVLIVILGLFAVFRGLFMAQPDPKLLSDVATIPIFMMLGMAFDQRGLGRAVLALHTIVFVVFLVEVLAPHVYSDLLQIQDYYIKTRGNKLDQF
jgi:hypothetical protein